MAAYFFTFTAEADLEAIYQYTKEKWGDTKAIEYLVQLEEVIQLLAENPEVGKPRDELADGLYSFPNKSHIIFYIKRESDILIVRLLHSSMDAQQHLLSD